MQSKNNGYFGQVKLHAECSITRETYHIVDKRTTRTNLALRVKRDSLTVSGMYGVLIWYIQSKGGCFLFTFLKINGCF